MGLRISLVQMRDSTCQIDLTVSRPFEIKGKIEVAGAGPIPGEQNIVAFDFVPVKRDEFYCSPGWRYFTIWRKPSKAFDLEAVEL
jgi:hypothetical protein